MIDSLDAALFFSALVGMAVGVGFERVRVKAGRAGWRDRKGGSKAVPFARRTPDRRPPDPRDPADQLRIVSEAAFGSKRLMNAGEFKVFTAAERVCQELGHGWRVHAQVSLGEVLTSPSADAHRCVNSKRVDMLIFGPRGEPLAAVEYQGQGHHLGTTAPARDAVKREALRRAGVRFVEMTHEHGPEDLKRELGRIGMVQALG